MKASRRELVMEALDTNILVRIATRDDADQLRKVETLMRENFSERHPAWVSVIVLAELSWVLSRTYGYLRPEIAAFLRKLLNTASIRVEDYALAADAIFCLFSTESSIICFNTTFSDSESPG